MHGRQEGRLGGRKEILEGLQTASRVAGLCEQLHPQTTAAMPAERGTKGTDNWPGCHPAGHPNCSGSDELFLRLPVTPWGCQWAVTGIPCSQACRWASCQKQSPASVSKHKVNRPVSSASMPSTGPLSSSAFSPCTWLLIQRLAGEDSGLISNYSEWGSNEGDFLCRKDYPAGNSQSLLDTL